MLAVSALHAGYFTWRMRRVLRYSLRDCLVTIGLGVLFLPLLLLRSSWTVNVALYGVFVLGYSGVLLLLRVVTRNEVSELWQAVVSRGGTFKQV